MAGDRTPWRFRFTLYVLLFPLQTQDRIRAILDWGGFADWRQNFSGLQTDTAFLNEFEKKDQTALKDNAAQVLEQFSAWEARVRISKWIFWPIYMAVGPILLSVALWIIGEPVFALRGHPYYCIFLLTLLKCSLSPYATAGVFKRLHKDFGATTPFPAILFSVAAFGPGCGYLYRANWYLVINIVATSLLICAVQYFAIVRDLWRDWLQDREIVRRGWRIRSQGRPFGPGLGQDAHILTRLTAIEVGLNHYRTAFSDLRGDFVHNVQDVAVREGAEKIIKVLDFALSPDARQARRSNSEGSSTAPAPDSKIKSWFTVGFFVFGLATVLTLIEQPGSLVQAIVSVLAGGCMMIIMTFLRRFAIDPFIDYYVPKMAGLFWALFHVNFLLIKNPRRFADNRVLFWVTYGVLFFETFFLSDLLVYHGKRYLKKRYAGTTTPQSST